ncbi:hypothetical protein C0036_04060 [Streptomyces sp. DJ]|nr:hypothetical protein C0036_04060 [Streptomyces sp. DJ]
MLAAAALHALDHHVERLAEDHANAARFADALAGLPGLAVEPARTNMVFAVPAAGLGARIVERLRDRGVLCTGDARLRFVLHLDVSREDAEEAARLVRETVKEATG